MKTTKKVGGAAIATAAALLIGSLAAGTASAADEAKIKCQGVNACKGQSACKSSQHACKGMNSCKGQGSVEMTKSDCKTAQAKAKSASKSAA
jgi:hypothetical protein